MSVWTPANRFALRLIAWSLALFGLFRVPWLAAHVVLPATQLQAAAGAALFGPSILPVEATLACSGADALALCLAAILAYPAPWRARASGVGAASAAVLALNTIRIGTLGRATASPSWFYALHVYLWPALLTVAIAAIVWTWMQIVDRPPPVHDIVAPALPAPIPLLSFRFAIAAAGGLALFTLAAPLYLESPRVLAVAVLVARAAALLLRGAGTAATASAGVLTTSSGAFLVTQECISTPLIPIYFAAVLVHARPWRRAALWAVLGAPLFFALGVARLLVVAIPAGIDRPPAFLVHAFSQLLVAAGLVCAAALWRYGARVPTFLRIGAALALAVAFVLLLGEPYTRAILGWQRAGMADPQGALRFLPAFQFGLFLALWVAAFVPIGWTRFLSGAALLAAVQFAVGAGVPYVAAHAGLNPLVRDVRAWALAGPLLIIAAVVNRAPARR